MLPEVWYLRSLLMFGSLGCARQLCPVLIFPSANIEVESFSFNMTKPNVEETLFYQMLLTERQHSAKRLTN
jgi:hypothetical protein